MKKTKTQNKPNNVPVIALILVFSILGGYFIWKNYFQPEEIIDENTEGSAPEGEDLEYMETVDEKCPVRALESTVLNNTSFSIYSSCPFARDEGDLGEDVTVEVYTTDFEVGKQEFRNWLAENGLEESEKLRVEYVHKP